MAHRISKLLQQLMYRRRPVFCPFLQSVRLESSLHPNHPNPIPEDFPWTSRTRERTPRDPLVLPRAKEDLKYTRLAQFAISEYNKKENARLEFVRVEGACLQHTCYSFYYIILDARDASAGGEKGLYRAKVLRDHDSKSIKFIRMVPIKQQPLALAKETKPSNREDEGDEEEKWPLV